MRNGLNGLGGDMMISENQLTHVVFWELEQCCSW